MWRRRILAIAFSALLSLTTAVPAFAHHKPWHHHGHGNGNRQSQTQTQTQTQDQSQRQCIIVIGLLQPANC